MTEGVDTEADDAMGVIMDALLTQVDDGVLVPQAIYRAVLALVDPAAALPRKGMDRMCREILAAFERATITAAAMSWSLACVALARELRQTDGAADFLHPAAREKLLERLVDALVLMAEEERV